MNVSEQVSNIIFTNFIAHKSSVIFNLIQNKGKNSKRVWPNIQNNVLNVLNVIQNIPLHTFLKFSLKTIHIHSTVN